jgi:hypothetical protein
VTFDTTAIVLYAAICGTLPALAPSLGDRVARIAIGGGGWHQRCDGPAVSEVDDGLLT